MAATRTAWIRRRSGPSARVVLTRCQIRLKSPSSEAAYISRSRWGCPRRLSTRVSMAVSKRATARVREWRGSGTRAEPNAGPGSRRDGHEPGRGGPRCLALGGQLLGHPPRLRGVAAEDGAVGVERAVVAQTGRLGPEVLALAGPLDGLPQRAQRAAGAAGGAVGRLG